MARKAGPVRATLVCACGREASFAASSDAGLSEAIAAARWTLDESRYVGGARLAGKCPECRASGPTGSARMES
jgi:hypothetical protein